jgi:hypothetical protein
MATFKGKSILIRLNAPKNAIKYLVFCIFPRIKIFRKLILFIEMIICFDFNFLGNN